MANEQVIIDTAERLLADTGRIPTVEAVRKALGGGSFSTLSPVLRDWRRQRQTGVPAAGEIPARVREALERATAALWGALREEAEERAARAREEADARAGDAEAERGEALREVARLEADLARTAERAAREREVLTRERDEARAALAGAREENATLAERARQQDIRIEALAAELEAERQARRAAEGGAAELKAENARLQERAGHVDELRAHIKALQGGASSPANQSQPQAPAKAGRIRKKGGERTAAG
jgi:chromosome segregation ATPase